MKVFGCIYALVENGTKRVRYVGQARIALNLKLRGHISKAKSGKGKFAVHDWLRSINLNASIKKLDEARNIKELRDLERKWISKYVKTGLLTNMTHGGEGCPEFKLTSEQKAKISESNKRRMQNPVVWVRISKSIAEANIRTKKGKPWNGKHTKEGLRKISEVNRRPKTESEKLNMRRAHQKRLQDPKARQRLIDNLPKGPLSEATKKKLSEGSKGKPKSAETRRRMKAAWILRKQAAK